MPATAVTIIEAWEGNDTLSERGGAIMSQEWRYVFTGREIESECSTMVPVPVKRKGHRYCNGSSYSHHTCTNSSLSTERDPAESMILVLSASSHLQSLQVARRKLDCALDGGSTVGCAFAYIRPAHRVAKEIESQGAEHLKDGMPLQVS